MKIFWKRILVMLSLVFVTNSLSAQGLTLTGMVEASDLTITTSITAAAITTTGGISVGTSAYIGGNISVVGSVYLPNLQIVNLSNVNSFSTTGTGGASIGTGGLNVNSSGISVSGTINAYGLTVAGTITAAAITTTGTITAKGGINAQTVTGSGYLQLRQTGDQFGESGVYIYHRNGSNGAIFYTGNNVDLVDFGFLSLTTNSQYNLRFEHRAGTLSNAANTAGEFQFFNTRQAGVDVGTIFAAIGPVTSSFSSGLSVTGNVTVGNAGLNVSSAGITATGTINAYGLTVGGSVYAAALTTSGGISVGTGAFIGGDLSVTGSIRAAGLSVAGSIRAANFNQGFTTTATAGTTTTLTSASNYLQEFTGSSNQTVSLPNVNTLDLGESFAILNNSTGNITVNSQGGNIVKVLPPNSQTIVTSVSTSVNTAAGWNQTSTNSFISGGGVGSALTSTGAITTTETVVVSSLPLAADRLLAGTVIRVVIEGNCASTVTTRTPTFRIHIGTNGTIADATPVAFTGAVGGNGSSAFKAVMEMTVRNVGATANVGGNMVLMNSNNLGIANVTLQVLSPTLSTINTTSNGNIITGSVVLSGANSSIVVSNAYIEIINR